MKFSFLCSCILATCIAAFSANNTLLLKDASEAGSPLQNVGTVNIGDLSAGHAPAYDAKWSVRNASTKPIVALIQSVAIEYRGRVIVKTQEQYERFFWPQLLNPVETISFDSTNGFVTSSSAKLLDHGADDVVAPPRCKITTLWVQFSDGTTFGDGKYAETLLKDRQATLNALTQLKDLYDKQGSSAFLYELQNAKLGDGVTGYQLHLVNLRNFYAQSNDLSATLNKLREYLTSANSRLSLLH